jgi:leader peptidase (prepilin peptidase)/N-methyltransferase
MFSGVMAWQLAGVGLCRRYISDYPVSFCSFTGLLNGFMYLITGAVYGPCPDTLIMCLANSVLIAVAVIDFRTFIIPRELNIFIAILGLVRMILDFENYPFYILGFVSVAGPLYALWYLSRGRFIGGGDVKLMAAAGLLTGFKMNFLAFFVGSIYCCIIHPIRMMALGRGHVLALGPYLSAGIITAVLAGDRIITLYLNYLY